MPPRLAEDSQREFARVVEEARKELTASQYALLVDILRAYRLNAITEGLADLSIRMVLARCSVLDAYDRIMRPYRPYSFTRYSAERNGRSRRRIA